MLVVSHPSAVTNALTDTQAFTTLLTLESFLLAVVALCVTLTQPDQKRVRALPVSAKALAQLAAGGQVICAAGALVALGRMLARGNDDGFWAVVMIACIVVMVVAQPIFGFMLAQGARFR